MAYCCHCSVLMISLPLFSCELAGIVICSSLCFRACCYFRFVCVIMVVSFASVSAPVVREVFSCLRPLTPHSFLARGLHKWKANCRDALVFCAVCSEICALTVPWRRTCLRYIRSSKTSLLTIHLRYRRLPQLSQIVVALHLFDYILREFSLHSFRGHPDCDVSIAQVIFVTWPCVAQFASACNSAAADLTQEESLVENVGRIVFPDFQWTDGASPLGWGQLRAAFAFCRELCDKVKRIHFEDDALRSLEDALRLPPEGNFSNSFILKRLFRAVGIGEYCR